ncbi:MAG: hypothetical protein HY791_07500 [Deltaproteobacteria bacterium]|nr:hypothetical protein [Deltaproteobacteria bacterium]
MKTLFPINSITASITLLLLTACLGERASKPGDAGVEAADAGSVDRSDASSANEAGVGEADAPDAPEVSGLPMGAACVASAECASQHCAVPCDGYGSCAPLACLSDGECEVPGSDRTHCCVSGRCEASEGACGLRTGVQGSNCGEGGATDCAAGLACLDACVSTSYCAASCTADSECEALDPMLGCFHVVGGGQRCVRDPDKLVACVTDRDCDPDSVCTPSVSFEGNEVIKTCTAPTGRSVTGASCTRSETCRSGLCMSGLCTAGCGVDADCVCSGFGCARDQICLDVWFSVGGTPSATKLCSAARRCATSSDCEGTRVCQPYPERDGWETVCGVPRLGAADVGGACAENADCRTLLCHEASCRATCDGTSTSSCPAGGSCESVVVEGSAPGASVAICL